MLGFIFRIVRSKIARATLQTVSPIASMLARTGRFPNGFWEDEYVLGYIYGSITTSAKSAAGGLSGGLLNRTRLIEAMIAIFSQLSGIGNLVKRIAPHIHTQSKDFQAGVDNAVMVISVAQGMKDYDEHADVITAKQHATQSKSSDRGSLNDRASAFLQEKLFYDVVAKRLASSHNEDLKFLT